MGFPVEQMLHQRPRIARGQKHVYVGEGFL
jgi:hypothetical protein